MLRSQDAKVFDFSVANLRLCESMCTLWICSRVKSRVSEDFRLDGKEGVESGVFSVRIQGTVSTRGVVLSGHIVLFRRIGGGATLRSAALSRS